MGVGGVDVSDGWRVEADAAGGNVGHARGSVNVALRRVRGMPAACLQNHVVVDCTSRSDHVMLHLQSLLSPRPAQDSRRHRAVPDRSNLSILHKHRS